MRVTVFSGGGLSPARTRPPGIRQNPDILAILCMFHWQSTSCGGPLVVAEESAYTQDHIEYRTHSDTEMFPNTFQCHLCHTHESS